MSSEFLGERKEALEQQFFHNQDAALLAALKEKKEAAAHRAALAEASSITDDAILSRLVELDIHANTLAALTLVPLVAVAWADGRMEEKERDAVLAAAGEHGVAQGTASWDLLNGWLDSRPAPAVLEAWKEYMGAIVATLDHAARKTLQDQILTRAKEIADAAGGVFGFGDKVSPGEQRMLDELRAVFGE